jgi:hypothetical protein
VTERPVHAAAQVAVSGEVSRASWSSGSTTSDTGLHLTSLHGSWVAPRRRDSGDGEDSTAAAENLG